MNIISIQANIEGAILNTLCEKWGVTQNDLLTTADRFFNGYKQFGTKLKKQSLQIVELQLKFFITSDGNTTSKNLLILSDEPTPTLFISIVPQYAQVLSMTL